MTIHNTRVYDLEESIHACRYAMATHYEPANCNKADIQRATRLVKASATDTEVHCHDNFLTGIRVSFDITYPQYWALEAQRYHFFDIVTSSSKQHRLCEMDIDQACNRWVSPAVKNHLRTLIDIYNDNPTADNWQRVVSNCPMGLQLFMRVSTNYKQLQTIYHQRRHHRLREWHTFCNWIETLPMFNELIHPNHE